MIMSKTELTFRVWIKIYILVASRPIIHVISESLIGTRVFHDDCQTNEKLLDYARAACVWACLHVCTFMIKTANLFWYIVVRVYHFVSLDI